MRRTRSSIRGEATIDARGKITVKGQQDAGAKGRAWPGHPTPPHTHIATGARPAGPAIEPEKQLVWDLLRGR